MSHYLTGANDPFINTLHITHNSFSLSINNVDEIIGILFSSQLEELVTNKDGKDDNDAEMDMLGNIDVGSDN